MLRPSPGWQVRLVHLARPALQVQALQVRKARLAILGIQAVLVHLDQVGWEFQVLWAQAVHQAQRDHPASRVILDLRVQQALRECLAIAVFQAPSWHRQVHLAGLACLV